MHNNYSAQQPVCQQHFEYVRTPPIWDCIDIANHFILAPRQEDTDSWTLHMGTGSEIHNEGKRV